MDFLKELFNSGALTWEQFSKAVFDKGFKIVDLSKGEYVSKLKYDTDLQSRDEQINTLNDRIETRDNDLAEVKKKLEAAGADTDKITKLTADLTELKTKYDNDTQEYKRQLDKQAYGFAVREFAGTQKFTSEAAKREFIRSLEEKELQLDNGKIMGVSDFLTQYKADNADSFAPSEPSKVPKFIDRTGGEPSGGTVTKEQFAKMNYAQRNELFHENRELYDELSKE